MFATLTRLLKRPEPIHIPVVEILPADNSKITPDERKMLREWLKRPDTKLALSLIESQKFSVLRSGYGGTVDQQRHSAERRLYQLQGWETYRNTLLNLQFTPQEMKQALAETFDSEP